MGTRTQAPENIPKPAKLQVNAVDSADKPSVDQAPKSVLRKKTIVEEGLLPRKKARVPSISETIKSDFSASSTSSLQEADDGDPVKLAETFKETFSRDSVRVHFVGAWYVTRFLDNANLFPLILAISPGIQSLQSALCATRFILTLQMG